MGRACYGNSGLSGLSASDLPSHDPQLVRVVDENRSLLGLKFTLVSPFAGKSFSLPMYERNLRRIPVNVAHAVFYDNSNDEEFQQKLRGILTRNFKSWTLIEDRNRPVTLETVAGIEEYRRITSRVAAVYGGIYSKFVPDLRYALNLEDDVEIPDGCFERLASVIEMDDRVATVIGNCRDRRTGYQSTGRPIAFDFLSHQKTTEAEPDSVSLVLLNSRSFGVHAIGAGHMGLWLTKRDALDAVQIGEEEAYGIEGTDLIWGWRLKEANRIFAIDWSVDCRHWYKKHGRMVSV